MSVLAFRAIFIRMALVYFLLFGATAEVLFPFSGANVGIVKFIRVVLAL